MKILFAITISILSLAACTKDKKQHEYKIEMSAGFQGAGVEYINDSGDTVWYTDSAAPWTRTIKMKDNPKGKIWFRVAQFPYFAELWAKVKVDGAIVVDTAVKNIKMDIYY